MESQIPHPHGHNKYEQDPHDVGLHSVVEVEEEHHQGTKSVLKKVKAKAKKIKDALTKHGHGQDHDGDQIPDDHDLDEEDDEEEEIVEDPEIHGAPMYESTAIRNSVPGEVESSMPPGLNYERPTPMRVDRAGVKERHEAIIGKKSAFTGEHPHAPQNTPVSLANPGGYETGEINPAKSWIWEQEEGNRGQPRVNLDRPRGLEEDSDAPKYNPDAYTPANYQTKVTAPTAIGGQEAGLTPILQSFVKMNISDEPKTGQKQSLSRTEPDKSVSSHMRDEMFNLATVSHDQFSPEPTRPKPIAKTENPQTFDATKDQAKQHDEKPANESSYSEKISFATSALAEKAASAKNVVASKLGYGEKDKTTAATESHEGGAEHAGKSASAVEYGKKIATTVTEKLTPVYEKVAGAGSTVMSKVRGTGSTTSSGSEQEASGVKGQDKGVSVKDYLAEKLKPGEEDKALSCVISEALHKPFGKVTESKQVARQLGSDDELSHENVDSSSVSSPGKGVVDKLKGAVGSLLGKEEKSASPQPQESFGSSYDPAEHTNGGFEGQRRLQESGN